MIGFIVSCFEYNNTGKGGHYYTAQTIYRELRKHRKSTLMVIGDLMPAAIDTSEEGIHFLGAGRWIKAEDINKLTEFIQKNDIKVLHCFDTYAFLFCRFAVPSSSIRIVLTKCGGPPAALHYYPGICPDTVFSLEDQAYFERLAARFRIAPPILLPNRVGDLPQTDPAQNLKPLPKQVNPNAVRIIRIARIYGAYEQSIFQTIALGNALRDRGLDVALYIVGFVQDANVYRRVKSAMAPSDFLLTESCHTRDASRHLTEVDIAVGSGRGAMEASISEKIVLCSVKDADHPYLLDADNVTHFFRYNFSSRAPKPSLSENRNLTNIVNLLTDSDQKARYYRDMKAVNDRYFKISSVVQDYLALYATRRPARPFLIDALDRHIHRMVSIAKLGIRKLQHTRGRHSTADAGS